MKVAITCPSCSAAVRVERNGERDYRCPQCGRALHLGQQTTTLKKAAVGFSTPTVPPDELRLLREGDAAPVPAARAPSFPGYEVLEVLGEGGMGKVYKARQLALNRIVALKVIKKDWLTHSDSVRRFQREAQAAGRLAHPNIITVHDAGEVAGQQYLVMEFVQGTDLARLTRQSGSLLPEQACDYIRQAALGLEHARERGLVHRDIKPANLLLAADSKVIKILDLGLARLVPWGDERRITRLTVAGVILGTPAYLAPEQAVDCRRVDTRADVYSLGCTLYYLLAGKAPFAGESVADIVLQHQITEPPPLTRPDLPAGLTDVLAKMLAKRPADRYQTPGEAATALASFTTAKAPGTSTSASALATPAEAPAPTVTADASNLIPVRRVPAQRWSAQRFAGLVIAAAGCLLIVTILVGQVTHKKDLAVEGLPPAPIAQVPPLAQAEGGKPKLPEPVPLAKDVPGAQEFQAADVPTLELAAPLLVKKDVLADKQAARVIPVELKAGNRYSLQVTSNRFAPELLVMLDKQEMARAANRSSSRNSNNGEVTQVFTQSMTYTAGVDGIHQVQIGSQDGAVGAFVLQVTKSP